MVSDGDEAWIKIILRYQEWFPWFPCALGSVCSMSFLQSSSGGCLGQKLEASWDLCCVFCGMKWKAEEWTMWLFFKTKVGDIKQNLSLGAAHVFQNCKRVPLCLLPLWVSNKLWAHKEQTTFQERPGFGSSTRKRNCKAQALPHPTHAGYKWGIRKIPFICADSFPALGFSTSPSSDS